MQGNGRTTPGYNFNSIFPYNGLRSKTCLAILQLKVSRRCTIILDCYVLVRSYKSWQ
jgi:hypothetical protein